VAAERHFGVRFAFQNCHRVAAFPLAETEAEYRQFAEMIRELRSDCLQQWMDAVQADDLPALHSFVAGLGRDQDAVVAGLTLRWSSGPVEGHVNRLKMLKRQMFGRANLNLLRRRVLATT
jgi:transposase